MCIPFAITVRGMQLKAEMFAQIDALLIQSGMDPKEHTMLSVDVNTDPFLVYTRKEDGTFDIKNPSRGKAIVLPAFGAVQKKEKANILLETASKKWPGIAFSMRTSDPEEPVLMHFCLP